MNSDENMITFPATAVDWGNHNEHIPQYFPLHNY